MKSVVWGLILLLIVLHQDVWFWEDGTLLFGFLPIGIGYHVGISLAAALAWWLATKYAWPEHLEAPVVAWSPDHATSTTGGLPDTCGDLRSQPVQGRETPAQPGAADG